ncbi:hypothetical protein TEA_011265 [Camellia sinensis var. sinensis]|uniref:Myb-like domain-containing protein n=1 Tax=Camellia sinensis var. sinensis TaxID=542762 RepID=A0A4S4EST6_CAMSN|nr:hypothetical protein TEA_011265 [Camellia sinensis var. sinensis]
MAASANPSGNNSNNNNDQEGSSANANGATNNGSSVPHDNSPVGPTQAALRHNPGLSVEWTPDEQYLLEDLLNKYSSERNIVRYAKIAMQLKDKTVRDVALRCRWMNAKLTNACSSGTLFFISISCFLRFPVCDTLALSGPPWPLLSSSPVDRGSLCHVQGRLLPLVLPRSTPAFPVSHCTGFLTLDKEAWWEQKKENGKRRKEDHNSARKNKDKKEKITDPMAKSASHVTNRSNGPPYAQSVISMDSDDGISYKAIGGVKGELLEQNGQALEQISANFASLRIHENINLFCQTQNNILTILNDMNDMPEIMKQMPPLPVKLNEELANSILPPPSLQKNS